MTDIPAEFERCKPWLLDALSYSNQTHAIDDVWDGIVSGQFQFWPAENGAIVTEILTYPQRKVFHVFLGGGKLDQLLDMVESIKIYARIMGCKSITISGRKGWTKVFESRGARQLCVTLAEEL